METANKLATLQEQNGQKIVQILNNAKKDSPSRKTEQYISERNSKIETLLTDCKNNHQKLQELDVPNHVYFTSKYYEQILRRVDETRKYLAECSKAPKPSEVNPEQDLRLRKQRVKINLLESTLNVVEKEIDEEKTKSRYETLLKKLSNSWGPIQELHEEITVYEEEFQDSYFTDDKYQQTESRYDECVAKLHATITTTNNVIKPNITLPKIELPYFRGGYEDWITFHDVFRKVIHENNSITRIEKMQYLKAHVREDASRLIQHLHISDGNYEAAWDLLVKRYQNTRLIFAKLMDQILDIPIVKGESVKQLQQLHDVTNECLKAVDNLGINTESWGPMIGRIISRKWDAETNKLYEQSLANPTYVQSLSSIMEFLERRFQSLETITNTNTTSIPQQSQKLKREQEGTFKCKICDQPHYISKCPKFLSMAPAERCSIIKEKKICYNCLRHGYQEKCFSLMSCQVCNKKHHTLLHVEKFTKNKSSAVKTNANTTTVTEEIIETEAVTSNHMGQPERSVLLATALIRVKSLAGNLEYLRVLIDSGSQAAFITEEAAQLLGHPRQKISAEISGLGENTKISKSKIIAKIQARFPSQFLLPVNFLVLSKLTQLLPSQQVMSTIPSEWQNHLLADPTFHKPGPIDAILGAEEVGHILEKGLEKTMDGLLGQETKFGWILSGSIKNNTGTQILSMVSCLEEDKQLTKFWDIEEVNHSVPKPLSQADADCERHYEENVKRSSNGTYTVRTPFKCLPNLGESKPRALARFIQLEKSKLNKPSNIKLRQQYNEFLKEYLDLGHMRLVKPHEKNTGRYYIPHQPVLRECSTTTKLRVVFDASSKSTNGKSLNDNMHIGPRLQQELTDILMRWRKHCIVFTADIEKMYRQISIAKEDQMYHRILWRFNITQPIQEYALTTVTYGTAAAPYLAVKTLQTLAKDEKLTFPRASAVAARDFYVDDLMTGADSIKEAIELQSEMINLLESGGFNMRKWASNKQELVENFPEELRNQATSEIFQDEIKKTLGVCWAPSEDTFRFKMEITMYDTITKRNILSEVAKLFDPLGWISPVVIQAKLIIQELWLQNLQWDQPVPTTIKEKWNCFYNQLKNVEQIHLPRWFHYSSNNAKTMEIHGFCDASEAAYGAVVYARITDQSGHIHVTLLASKSKVAPAKSKKSLPRLELCAALLLAKLMTRVKIALDITDLHQCAWTDSMITIAWIKGDPTRWKTFVANRTSEINTLIPSQHWYHVSTNENPADMISRGTSPSKIINLQLWWEGPVWLKSNNQPLNQKVPQTEMEQKRCFEALLVSEETCIDTTIIDRFSSLTKLVRTLSYCKRFINNAQKKKEKGTGSLTPGEMDEATTQIIKIVQKSTMREEKRLLEKNKTVSKNSKTANLNPFLDENGVIRVGGRLKNSSIPFDQKHPIILPNKSHFTTLVVREAHKRMLHGGNQITLAYIRRKYWIINSKGHIRSIIHNCPVCIRYRGQTRTQLMGDLPASRVTPSHPFSHTGIDYAGPISLRTTKGRGHKSYKGYIALFVCFATKAVHLEAVSDMTTESFLAAYRRFSSRRGHCSHMYSDNGTNFVGASNIINNEVLSILQDKQLQDNIATTGTKWHFIPPAAPHFGGLWEAGVKSTKFHLKRVVGESKLTYEELSTLLCQIEACLNSRPLCAITNDINDVEILSPGHFLIGREILTPSHPSVTDYSSNLVSRWRILQKMKKDFWSSWSTEYLSRLQQRYKWQTPQNNPSIGDIVLIKDNLVNPSKWPLAKIKEVHPDKDGNIRVVTIKKSENQTLKRSIHQLIPLPTEQDASPLIEVHQRKTKQIPILIPQGYASFKQDVSSVLNVSNQFANLCQKTKLMTETTQCLSLSHHLEEVGEEIGWTQQLLEDTHETNRRKRGLLGNLLTSMANSYITDISARYSKLLMDVRPRRGNLHDLLSPVRVKKIFGEETNINSTSIVQISQDCTIKTKQNILIPKRIDSVPVIASQQFNYSFNHMLPTSKPIQLLEPVYQNSEKLNMERNLDEELDETTWKKIQHHPWLPVSNGVSTYPRNDGTVTPVVQFLPRDGRMLNL